MRTDLATLVILKWRPLILSICRKYGRSYPWLYDDFVSDGFFALWKDTLRPERESPDQYRAALVATIARRAVWNCISRERSRNRAAFQSQRENDVGLAFLELLVAPKSVIEADADVLRLIEPLPVEAQQLILELMNGAPVHRLARLMGRHPHSVKLQVERLVERLLRRTG